ncbi:MAG TPA: hypothetical protein VE890_01965 [Thermoguttaceae bacterium]|nr:hypothetical protein [Thermoguttaceae bacterium]
MSDNGPQPPPKRPFQFGLASMLLVMVLFSVLAAALAGMLHRHQGRSTMQPGFFVLMAIAAPMGLMILASLLRAVMRYINRRR